MGYTYNSANSPPYDPDPPFLCGMMPQQIVMQQHSSSGGDGDPEYPGPFVDFCRYVDSISDSTFSLYTITPPSSPGSYNYTNGAGLPQYGLNTASAYSRDTASVISGSDGYSSSPSSQMVITPRLLDEDQFDGNGLCQMDPLGYSYERCYVNEGCELGMSFGPPLPPTDNACLQWMPHGQDASIVGGHGSVGSSSPPFEELYDLPSSLHAGGPDFAYATPSGIGSGSYETITNGAPLHPMAGCALDISMSIDPQVLGAAAAWPVASHSPHSASLADFMSIVTEEHTKPIMHPPDERVLLCTPPQQVVVIESHPYAPQVQHFAEPSRRVASHAVPGGPSKPPKAKRSKRTQSKTRKYPCWWKGCIYSRSLAILTS